MLKRLLMFISILFIAKSIINDNTHTLKKPVKTTIPIITTSEQPIAKLVINKINLKEYLYDINSSENTIEKHVSFLKESVFPDCENSITFIAAHSGEGKIAYFQELDKLEINDEIILYYKNQKYIYQITDIWEEKKNGYINVNKSYENQLILTTCSPNHEGYQLIINCTQKEEN